MSIHIWLELDVIQVENMKSLLFDAYNFHHSECSADVPVKNRDIISVNSMITGHCDCRLIKSAFKTTNNAKLG